MVERKPMSKIIIALTFIVFLNVGFFLVQTAMDKTSQAEGITDHKIIFNYDGSMIKQYDTGNYTLTNDVVGQLPQTESSVSPTTGNTFTDFTTAITGWFLSIPGMKYLVGIVNAVPSFTKYLGAPPEVTFAIGFAWYSITLALIVLLILGKDG